MVTAPPTCNTLTLLPVMLVVIWLVFILSCNTRVCVGTNASDRRRISARSPFRFLLAFLSPLSAPWLLLTTPPPPTLLTPIGRQPAALMWRAAIMLSSSPTTSSPGVAGARQVSGGLLPGAAVGGTADATYLAAAVSVRDFSSALTATPSGFAGSLGAYTGGCDSPGGQRARGCSLGVSCWASRPNRRCDFVQLGGWQKTVQGTGPSQGPCRRSPPRTDRRRFFAKSRLESGSLRPDVASKLAGRLAFFSQPAPGCAGRAAINPLQLKSGRRGGLPSAGALARAPFPVLYTDAFFLEGA